MASKNTHIVVGAITGLVIYGLYKNMKKQDWDLIEVCGAVLLGGMIGRLPDILEPATSSYHRKFYHSIALLIAFSFKDKAYNKLELNENQRACLDIAIGSYSSHLVVDSIGKRGLPLI